MTHNETCTGDQERFGYRCFGECGREFDSLDDMVFVAGRGNRDGRHFCRPCARSLPHHPDDSYVEAGSS